MTAPLAAGPVGPPLELTLVSGLSGAGRSTAAKCLEDLGWFVVDNLPPALLATLAELGARSQGTVHRIAVVVDVRGRRFFDDLTAAIAQLRARGVALRVVFLDADDAALVRRYEAVRRPHPLQERTPGSRLLEGIARERDLLRELKAEADLVVDTTSLNVHQLRAKIDDVFAAPAETATKITVLSFGFKYGLPLDADFVLDVRWLPNPHWIPELQPLNGRDAPVRDYVLSQPGAQHFFALMLDLVATVLAGSAREGRHYLTVAIGCTGGKHRSVALAEALVAGLAGEARDVPGGRARDGDGDVPAIDTVALVHRDLGRE